MLEFSTQASGPEESSSLAEIDPEGLMDRLIAAGHLVLPVAWEDCGVLKFAVEDEAIFLCEAFRELPAFIQCGGEHKAFLGDGALQTIATRDGDVVRLVRQHVPFLHRGLKTTKSYTMSLDAYVGAWTRLIRGLVELANQHLPAPPLDPVPTRR